MRLYTRGGDRGQTALIGGERRYKDDARVEAYGTVDEAGAAIGLAMSLLDAKRDSDILTALDHVQQRLWDVGADLAAPRETDQYAFRTPTDAAASLEPVIDDFQGQLGDLSQFILRAGSTASAALHLACTVVRRAERRVVALMRLEEIHAPTLQYINRLSDLLFVLARVVNAREQGAESVYENSTIVFRSGKSNGGATDGD